MMGVVSRTSAAILLVAAPVAAAAQKVTPLDSAIAVCASQRAPFVDLRDRYKKEISERTTKGILVGVLGGAGLGALATKTSTSGPSTAGVLVGALLGGITGGYVEYLAAKRQISQDNRELSRMIDADARGYVSRIQTLADSIKNTGKCRIEQINVWEQRVTSIRSQFAQREDARNAAIAAAADDKARKAVTKAAAAEAKADAKVLAQLNVERGLIEAAINADKKTQDEVLRFFDNDIRAMAQAQAEVEGTSEASLRGPAEGYVVDVVPPAILASATSGVGGAAPPVGFGTSVFGAAAPAAAPAPPPPVAALPPPPPPVAETPPSPEKRPAGKPAGTAKAAKPVQVASAPPPPPKKPLQPWEPTVTKPSVKPANGQQAAYIARQDAAGESQSAFYAGLARLKLAFGGEPAGKS